MGRTTRFNRMPRIKESLPEGEVKIPAPPNVNPPSKFSWFQLLLPLGGLFVMVGIYGGVQNNWHLAIPMVAMSGFSVLGSIVGRVTQRKNYKQEVEEKKAAYGRVLDQKKAQLESYRQEQQRIRNNIDPDLQTLLNRARNRDRKLWERRPEDEDFLSLRFGLGELPSTVAVKAPHPDMPDPNLEEAQALEAEYVAVPNVPVTTSIRPGPLGLAGPLSDRTGEARALICNLAVHHSPDEVHLLAIHSPRRTHEWEWLKWLPHTYALENEGGKRYLANDSRSAEKVLKGLLEELHRRQNQSYGVRHGEKKPDWPWLVLLVEDYALVKDDPAIHLLLSPEARELNVTAIFMVEQDHQVPMGCSTVVTCQPTGQVTASTAGIAGDALSCWPEYADAAFSEQLARHLAPVRVYTLQSDDAMPSHVRLLDIMNIRDMNNYDAISAWQQRSPDEYLKVPIGERRGNQSMVLNLDHTGHGPHGLIAGTTGSGKSELLQTLVAALALTHHPHDVGFILVDFKGGGTFSELVNLPHTLGMVTDLSGNLTQRALVALEAEMDRRKRLFNDAGVNDIIDYQKLYWQGGAKTPLPRVVVIIDEFAELVTDYPDFMDGLIAVARVGRSLGVHLILATQSPAGVVKQQIWANAKFRICLRVEDRQESMDMLHRPEAANLPRMPGRGYLQVGNNDVFELFQVARVAGPYHIAGDTGPLQSEKRIVISEVSPLGDRKVLRDSKQSKQPKDDQSNLPTDIQVTISKLQEAAKQISIEKLPSPWPDPLPDHVALPDLLRQEEYGGWNGAGWVFDRPAIQPQVTKPQFCNVCGEPLREGAKFCRACGEPVHLRCSCGARVKAGAQFCPSCGTPVLTAAPTAPSSPPSPRPPTLPNRPWLGALIGLMDDPANQRQLPLLLKLAEQDGQLIVVGAPGSGKEMWARTLVTSLSRTHTPDELHFHLLEFGGQALKALADIPHVGSVLTPLDDERVKRLLRLLLDDLDERKHLCNQAGVDGLIRLRELQPGQAPPATVLVITGFMEFRRLFQDEMLQLTRLIREGGPYGIHVVLIGDRAGDIPTKIGGVVARRLVLRLADADEYTLAMGTRLKPSKEQKFPPGRGWYGRPPLEIQTASPGHEKDENKQIAEVRQLADKMDQAWQGERPKPVGKLSDEVPLAEVLKEVQAPPMPPTQPETTVPLGLDAVRLQPVLIDLVEDGSDFIVASTPQGGKTTLLLTWTLALAEFNSPQQVQFVLMSGRRNSLQPVKDLPHVLDFCRTPEDFCEEGTLDRLQNEIQRREELLSKTPSLANELPHIVVIFDDYNEFANAIGTKAEVKDGLSMLAKQGRNVNLHTIVAGPSPKLGVGFSDPLVSQLKIGRSGFLLRILDANEQSLLGLRLRPSEIGQMPPGRGYVVRSGFEEKLQVATPGNNEDLTDWVNDLRKRWQSTGIASAGWSEETYGYEDENGDDIEN
jgi:S-DNA-T family DNA segregation ATPase FtsK/SpoIIIE